MFSDFNKIVNGADVVNRPLTDTRYVLQSLAEKYRIKAIKTISMISYRLITMKPSNIT